jgi:hypothetical protein
MRRKGLIICRAALAVFLALPVALSAAPTETSPLMQEVTSQMQEAKRSSWELRKTADTLHAITRSGGHSWQSHSSYLNTAREYVNQLGKMLVSLENLKQHGTESQQSAIESSRPKLVQTANALTSAIELLNDRRHNVYFSGYRDAVRTVSEQSDSLHNVLDVVLKYEAAKARLDNLEIGPAA